MYVGGHHDLTISRPVSRAFVEISVSTGHRHLGRPKRAQTRWKSCARSRPATNAGRSLRWLKNPSRTALPGHVPLRDIDFSDPRLVHRVISVPPEVVPVRKMWWRYGKTLIGLHRGFSPALRMLMAKRRLSVSIFTLGEGPDRR